MQEGDTTTKVFLEGLLKNLIPFIAVAQNIVDLYSACNTPYETIVLDSQIENYIGL